jgi:hypothetical protein
MKFNYSVKAGLLACLLSSTTFAADEVIPVITATPNKTMCALSKFNFKDAPINGEICITQGSFSPDKYVLKFNGEMILQGVDDQTTLGISATYKEKKISLKCTPQLIKGNATADEVHNTVPTYSDSKVKDMVELMKGSELPVEVGRLCAVRSADDIVMKAQVFFE